MERRVFAHGSGVVVDRCRRHGVWFDGGEIALASAFFRHGGPNDPARRGATPRRWPAGAGEASARALELEALVARIVRSMLGRG
jgi:hypothetical protein